MMSSEYFDLNNVLSGTNIESKGFHMVDYELVLNRHLILIHPDDGYLD